MKKSKSRTEMRSKIAKRMQELGGEPTEELTGQEAVNAVMGLHVIGEPVKIVAPIEPETQIVLYLRDGVNPAEKNFTKYPNDIHLVIKDRLGDMSEGVVYVYLWRQSWGFGRNYCRVSHKTVVKDTLVKSRSTVQKAMSALVDKRFVVKALTGEGDQDVNQTGALYRILTPSEITAGRTEEGVSLDDLSIKGVPMIGIPINGTPTYPYKQGNGDGIPINGIPIIGHTDDRYTDNQHTSVPISGIPIISTPDVKPHDDKPDQRCTDKRYTDNRAPFKEDSLKDSLSPDLIEVFYTGIGQQRISKAKRERGDSVLQELRKEGFSPEDIQFAIEWTLKPGNTKEKVHDFGIVSHTIGQALSAREAGQQAADAAQKEEARVRAGEEERSRLEGKIRDLRSALSEEELAELREHAENEIRESGEFSPEFINEPLITARENEILRRNNQ